MRLLETGALASVLRDSLHGDKIAGEVKAIAEYLECGEGASVAPQLLAELLNDMPDDAAQRALNHYVQRTIGTSNDALCDFSEMARLCLINLPLLRSTQSNAGEVLSVCCQRLAHGFFNGFAVPTAGFLEHHYPLKLDENQDLNSDSDCSPEEQLEVAMRYLTFLKHLFWFPDSSIASTSPSIPVALLALTGASSSDMGHAALETLSAMFLRMKDSLVVLENQFNPVGQGLGDAVWERILDLIYDRQSSHMNAAMKLWLQWVALPLNYQRTTGILCSENYWRTLLACLREGTQEQRKSSLYILNLSINMLQTDVTTEHFTFSVERKDTYKQEYAKYCTVFENTVLGRYLNQVEDSFDNFKMLFHATSLVHSSWLFALLTAAMSPGVQGSIREVVGTWVMGSEYHVDLAPSEEHLDFFEHSFLLWAAQGQLFVTSMRRTPNGNIQCRHGEKLLHFVEGLLSSSTGAERQALARGVLSFIAEKGQGVFPYAAVYMLQGLYKGIKSHNAVLGEECIDLAHRIALVSRYSDLIRDMFSVLCFRIAICAVPTTVVSAQIESLGSRFRALSAAPTETPPKAEDINPNSLRGFVSELEETNHRSIRGSRLRPASRQLLVILDSMKTVENAETTHGTAGLIKIALDALWEEITVQDYPKHLLMCFPCLALHRRSLEHSILEPELANTISGLILDMQGLSRNRIYAFSPLARALRDGLMAVPKAVHLFIEDFIVHFANHPPTPKLEFQLEAAVARLLPEVISERTYKYYYGEEEGYGYACIFDLLNRRHAIPHALARRTIDRLVEPWVNQKQPVPIFSKWKTTTQFQTVLVLYEVSRSDPVDNLLDYALLQNMFKILSLEPVPRFRFLMEWIIGRICWWNTGLHQHLLSQLSNNDHSNSKYHASLMKVATAIQCSGKMQEGLASKLMALSIPLAASSKIIIRHEAQWSFPQLWATAEDYGWTSITGNPAYAALNDHIRSLERYQTPPLQRILDRFNLVSDHTMTNLFEGDYLHIDPPEQSIVSRDDFLAVQEDDSELSWPERPLSDVQAPYESFAIALGDTKPPPAIPVDLPKQSPEQTALTTEPTTQLSTPLQTKTSAWRDTILTSLSHPSDSSSPRRTHPLIIIASLIDNPHNLGGLSRVCEIFGAQSLHVRNLNVLKDKNFSSVAVSSELHLPMRALPIDGIAEFLVGRKREGWTVVGVEQTDGSRVLGAKGGWKRKGKAGQVAVGEKASEGGEDGEGGEEILPEKCVLVLGSEREGIPARVLADMDFCVEIRQFGVTRSLNVQTAAAVVLYEYIRIHG